MEHFKTFFSARGAMKRLLFIAFVLAGLVACDKTDEALNLDKNEPNNSKEEATTLTLGTSTSAYVKGDDVDYYSFVPGFSNYFDLTLIEISNGDNELVLTVEILDQNGNRIDRFTGSAGGDLKIKFTNNGGTYYLKVTCEGGEGSYTVKVTDSPINDAFEPNDKKETAYELGTLPALNKEGRIVSGYDIDWFRFTTANNGVWDAVEIHLENLSETLKPELAIYNDNNDQLERLTGTDGGNLTLNLYTKGGSYFLKLNAREGQGEGAYKLSIQNLNANDDNEPDDDFAQARIIDTYPTGNINGTILVDAANDNGGDYEFFKVKLPVNKKIVWTVSPEANNTELHFDVYNLNEERLGGLDGDDGQTLQFYVNNTGTTDTDFYIRLGGFIGDNGHYTISFTEEDASKSSGIGISIR